MVVVNEISLEDAAAKRFEAGGIFTPSTPISVAEMFAGRQMQAAKIVDAIAERGRHVILYGERGVGKTSMAQIAPHFLPKSNQAVRYINVRLFPGATFSLVAKMIFSQIHFQEDLGEGGEVYDVVESYPGHVTIDHFLSEMKLFKESEIPLIVIDNFSEMVDENGRNQIANIIKELSDSGSIVTIIVVGEANKIIDLFEHHKSIERCTERILMPRMNILERKEILDRRLSQLDLRIDFSAYLTIVNLSQGLPAYVHALGKLAVYSALTRRENRITNDDVDAAIKEVVYSTEKTLRDSYEEATRSSQARALYRHLLTACALARVDDSGFFTPSAVIEPYSKIRQRAVNIANFQNPLKDLSEKRQQILERSGAARSYRYRFRDPAMGPYVIIRGIQDGLIDEPYKQALFFSEQPDFFSSA